MSPITIILILTLITTAIFLLVQPRDRAPLGAEFWINQEKTPIDLAKSFSYNGEVDRLVEMLTLDSSTVPQATSYRMYAAGTGIPILYHRHQVSWHDTEDVIKGLLDTLDDTPWEVLHAIMVLHIGGHLGSMEDMVVDQLLIMIEDPAYATNDKILAKICEALGLIGNAHALKPLLYAQACAESRYLKNVISLALDRMGYEA